MREGVTLGGLWGASLVAESWWGWPWGLVVPMAAVLTRKQVGSREVWGLGLAGMVLDLWYVQPLGLSSLLLLFWLMLGQGIRQGLGEGTAWPAVYGILGVSLYDLIRGEERSWWVYGVMAAVLTGLIWWLKKWQEHASLVPRKSRR